MLSKIPILISLMFTSTWVQSAELDGPATTFSSPINFCSTNAKKAIEDLDKITLNKVEEIKKIKQQVNELNAKKTLISGFLKIRQDFETSYAGIVNQEKLKDDNLSANLDEFKTLMKTSLTMSAVNLVASAGSKKFNNVTELCMEFKNAKTNFCEYVNNKWITSQSLSPEIKNLNETLRNVNLALEMSSNHEQIKTELRSIYDTIPSPVSPDKILSDLMEHSPKLVEALNNSSDKQTLMECLTNKPNAQSCKNLIANKGGRDNLKKILTSQMGSVHKEFIDNKFNDFFKKVDDKAPQSNESLQTLMNKKAIEASQYLENQFNNDSDGKLKNMGFNKSDLDRFKSSCLQTESSTFVMDECKKNAATIIRFFQREDADNEKQIQDALNRLERVVNDNGSLESVEKMKQYVAEKYLRTCKDAKEKDVVSNITCPCLNENEIATNLPGDTSQIGQLNLKLSSVISRLKNKTPLSTQTGELGPFSKPELEVYKNYCQNSTVARNETAASICRDVYRESNLIANQKDSQEWDDFNKKYWVEYSKTSKKGYEVYEKKSNARILGEGLSQSINKIYPAWLMNYQLNSQIDMMTNQALYQKQMMYMYNPTSPWMNMPYFQGSYYPSGNANTMTSGFNFSK